MTNINNSSSSLSKTTFQKKDIEQSISARFEDQVRRYPDHLAVKSRTQHITYLEFNAKANQLARALLLQHPGEGPVILLFEQGIDFLIALLAVLKMGRCYIPLDVSFPDERNAYILEDSQAKLILTQTKHLALAHQLVQNQHSLFNFDEVDSSWSTENLELPISPSALAYFIYTSGSTGQPKGVMQNHRNVLHNCMIQTHGMQITASDKMTLLYSCSTMGTVRNIFNALLNGVTLYPFNVKAFGFTHLADWIIQEGITVYHSVASLFRHFASTLTGQETFHQLRLIVLGGEATLKQDAELYKKYFPPTCFLYTSLGSTETGTVRQFIVHHETPLEGAVVPLGYAVEDKEILLLNDEGLQVHHGEVGEIVVRSQYLALGYWQKPDLTQATFTRDPTGQSVYRTGDMGYLLPEGCLIHRGRKDFQVKIRGYRVEISEIEALLLEVENIQEAVVVAHEVSQGEKRLVAYLVSKHPPAPTVGTLHQYLLGKLPDYMLPSTFIFLEALPRTPGGKINRLALPSPEEPTRPHLESNFVAPRTPLEEQLMGLWSQVLPCSSIGIHDNFFQLGGHSLLAAQVILRANEMFTIELPLMSLFEAPTLDQWAKNVQNAIEQEKTLKQPILRHNHQEPLPLSFAQQRLWFLDQLTPNNPFYHITKAIKIKGNLNITLLQRALETIVARHDILRTTIHTLDGNPVQQITEQNLLKLSVLSINKTKQEEILHLLETHAQHPFCLSTDLMLRATLLQLSPTEFILLLVMHHIAADGWSVGILFRELISLYEAFSQGQPSPLPPLPIQYADFAIWQRQWLSGALLQKQLSYWQRQLADIPTPLTLPTDQPRPLIQTFRGHRQAVNIDPIKTKQLQQLAQHSGATLFMILLAALMILLGRYSTQHHLVVGSPLANRNRRELEPLIGFFVNTLVFRGDLSGNPRFQAFLEQIRQTCLDVYAHQDLPFEKLVEVLQPERHLGYNPLFQVMLVLQNTPRESIRLPEVTMESLELNSISAKFDLSLSLEETKEGLQGYLEYNIDLFEDATISRLIKNFQTLLEDVVTHPHKPLSQLEILSEAERHQLWHEWNQTFVPFPLTCVHHLFEEQVEKTPEAIAVRFEEQTLSYRELNCRANQLAHYLKSLGVQTEMLVGICVERSLEMMIGLLGILKAGGAYVPLDPNYPAERLQFMLADAAISILLSQSSLQERLPEHQATVINLDRHEEQMILYSERNPEGGVEPKNLAYVIYTSGSTGQPKGVMVEHASIAQHICYSKVRYQMKSSDRVLQFASSNFDASLEQIFSALCSGAQLILLSTNLLSPQFFHALLEKEQVTVVNLPPAYWQQLLDEANAQSLASLRLLILGGDALSSKLVHQTRQTFSKITLLNAYGPTEATITATLFEVTEALRNQSTEKITPIGQPVANTQIYILDCNHGPTPIGVPGELCIAGTHLARGYLNRPALTAERFIEIEVFGQHQRIYKTGDLARYLPNGNIEYLGRIDHQVKLRGFRIELGEIEAILSQHPLIREAIVIMREDSPGDHRLVGYIVLHSGANETSNQVRQFLKEKLPDYMVPSGIVFLASFPLTPNGKIDRRALPKPEYLGNEEVLVAPRDEVELQLQRIWEEILQVHPIGITQNFFEVGGHSLLAIRLLTEVKKHFKKELSVLTLFQASTIEQLAKVLNDQEGKMLFRKTLLFIQTQGDLPPLFFVGSTNFGRLLSVQLGNRQPVYGLNIFGLHTPHEIETDLDVQAIAREFIKEVQRVQAHGPYHLCSYCADAKIAFEMAQQFLAQGESMAFLAFVDALWQKRNRYLRFWENLWKFGPVVSYLAHSGKRKLKFRVLQLKLKLNQWKKKWYQLHQEVPSSFEVQETEFIREFLDALRNYSPQPYSGKITLFLSTEWYTGELTEFSQFAQGGIDVYEIPGYHDSLFISPQIEILGKQLKACLDQLEKI